MKRIAILGLGNSVLGDDSVGLRVASGVEEARDRIAATAPDLGVFQDEAGGWQILDHVEGFDVLILVDAIQDPALETGQLAWYPRGVFRSPRISGVHNADVFQALELARGQGLHVPGEVHVLGVGIPESVTFSEQCSPPVEAAIPAAVAAVFGKIRELVTAGG